MKSISAYLGLAADATEGDIIAKITKDNVAQAAAVVGAQKEATEANAKVEALAGCAADLAVRCGVITVGQRDARVAYLKAAPMAAASELATAAPVLPAQRQESSDSAKSGASYASEKDPTEFPKDTAAQLALYNRNPELYHKLRNEARKGS